jgi:hypothetical protein
LPKRRGAREIVVAVVQGAAEVTSRGRAVQTLIEKRFGLLQHAAALLLLAVAGRTRVAPGHRHAAELRLFRGSPSTRALRSRPGRANSLLQKMGFGYVSSARYGSWALQSLRSLAAAARLGEV